MCVPHHFLCSREQKPQKVTCCQTGRKRGSITKNSMHNQCRFERPHQMCIMYMMFSPPALNYLHCCTEQHTGGNVPRLQSSSLQSLTHMNFMNDSRSQPVPIRLFNFFTSMLCHQEMLVHVKMYLLYLVPYTSYQLSSVYI